MNNQNKINKILWVALFAYSFLNIALLLYVDSGKHLTEGADAGTWYNPAIALLKYGSFVTLNSPEILMTYRGPLYPIYEAMMLWISNGEMLSIIVGQIAMLWITGVFVGRIVELFLPTYRNAAILLIVFNPNALAIAHLIQSDTMYAMFIVFSMWSLSKYMVSNNKLKWILITSIFLGASCLIRPTAQYIILLLPMILFIINTFYRYKNALMKSFVHGLIGIITSILVILPWVLHNEKAGWGYVLVTPQIKTVYLRDNVVWAEKKFHNISMDDAFDNILKSQEAYVRYRGEAWKNLNEEEKFSELVEFYWEKFISYPAYVLLAAYIDSWIDFFGGGGSVNFHNLLSIETVKTIELNKTGVYSSRLDAIFESLSNAPMQVVLISSLSYLYVIALRVLGLLGILEMIKRKRYSLLFVIIGLIVYFAMTALFVGNSRYRLPVEAAFVILALYGASFVKNIKKQKT
jgi:4-amino-4-deoxy-L-arabinose transferase-like glycosyltransferase